MTPINDKDQEPVTQPHLIESDEFVARWMKLTARPDRDPSEPEQVGEDDPVIQQMLKIVQRNRELSSNMLGSQDIDEYLYDESGLPK